MWKIFTNDSDVTNFRVPNHYRWSTTKKNTCSRFVPFCTTGANGFFKHAFAIKSITVFLLLIQKEQPYKNPLLWVYSKTTPSVFLFSLVPSNDNFHPLAFTFTPN